MSKPVVITVYKCAEVKKDGKVFTPWETVDKNKMRVSVSFVQGKAVAPENTCKIKVLDGFIDKRKRFEVLRIRAYEIVSDNDKKDNDELSDRF